MKYAESYEAEHASKMCSTKGARTKENIKWQEQKQVAAQQPLQTKQSTVAIFTQKSVQLVVKKAKPVAFSLTVN